MAAARGQAFCFSSFRLWSVDPLRNANDGSEERWAKMLRPALSLAAALLLLVTLRVLGQGLLMGVAGAALVLVLQEAVDPTPLFWTAPWEAMRLLLSREHRVNHIWLHRTQELARESIGARTKADGFAMADGFVLTGIGSNKQLVRWTAECAWRGVAQPCARARHPRGCKAVRFLLSVWLMSVVLLALGAWRGIDLPTALLIAAVSGAAGHALARPFEDKLGLCLGGPGRHNPNAGGVRVEIEPVEFPEWLWWGGSEGFIVRRIADGEPRRE